MERDVEQQVRMAFDSMVQSGVANRGLPQGCSISEIAQLEERIGNRLPQAYAEFLRLGGKDLGGFLDGSLVVYDEIDGINEGARELLEEHGFQLPERAFAFFLHGGYTTSFFILNDGEDPKVYCFSEEGEGAPESIKHQYSRFTDWLREAIDAERD